MQLLLVWKFEKINCIEAALCKSENRPCDTVQTSLMFIKAEQFVGFVKDPLLCAESLLLCPSLAACYFNV